MYERTADAVVVFDGDREELLRGICRFSYENQELQELVQKNGGRALNRGYKEKLIQKMMARFFTKLFLPEAGGVSMPAVSALLHKMSVLLLSLKNMANLLNERKS